MTNRTLINVAAHVVAVLVLAWFFTWLVRGAV